MKILNENDWQLTQETCTIQTMQYRTKLFIAASKDIGTCYKNHCLIYMCDSVKTPFPSFPLTANSCLYSTFIYFYHTTYISFAWWNQLNDWIIKYIVLIICCAVPLIKKLNFWLFFKRCLRVSGGKGHIHTKSVYHQQQEF